MPIQVTCKSCGSVFNAPDAAAGKKTKCPKCGGAIDIPAMAPADDILDAEESIPMAATSPGGPSAAPGADDRRPCPMCGEMIARDAVKCRFCNEVFDPVLRAQQIKNAQVQSGDADLHWFEWLLVILCSGIGCIVGIVYMIQGKPKGKKMVLIAICVQLIFGALQVVVQMAAHRR